MALYAFDGTWNDSRAEHRDRTKDTNVHLFRIAYEQQVQDAALDKATHYVEGVGNRHGLVGKLFDGAIGSGITPKIEGHMEHLRRNFAAGDTDIDIIGYSRGSATARIFVNELVTKFPDIERDGAPLTGPPPIRFLGLFDTVGSFGVPWTDNEGRFTRRIPDFVQNTFHAMALDETRQTFGLERCIGDRRNFTEVWFRGGHSDIGGNTVYEDDLKNKRPNRDRSNHALYWML
ncbi:MAG: DUF2235 domain-containing protein, partial [Verrucomicrobiota bacterium]